ncbi:MAG: recombinase RecA [Verrucomicrobiae bacterium]|nr:recombinase RecA [Verrucomicrobiae bacterium]
MAKATKGKEKAENRVLAAKDKNLELAIQTIAREFGEGAIMVLGDEDARLKVDVIPTGCLAIDHALGCGGLPRGRIVEIFGPESSGKTTLTLTAIAQAQKAGGIAAFIDAEHALDVSYARRLGVKVEELLISQPSSGEEALTIAETLLKSNALDVIVIDSVAALVPRAELEGNMGDAQMGLQARLMSQAMRKLTSVIAKAKTVCIFTNQIREKIGVMFGNPETTTGGKALKFYASMRIDIRRIAGIKGGDGPFVGNRTKIKVVKNKVAPPFAEAEFDILYNEGISREGSVIDMGIDRGVIEKRGAWLFFDGSQLAQGRDAAREELKRNPDLRKRIEDLIREKLAGVPAATDTPAGGDPDTPAA